MTLPCGASIDPDLTALEVDRMIPDNRICFGQMNEIPGPGDCIIDTSVVVVWPKDSSRRATVISCRHRAAQLLDRQGHAWSCDLQAPIAAWPPARSGHATGKRSPGTSRKAIIFNPATGRACSPSRRLDGMWCEPGWITCRTSAGPLPDRGWPDVDEEARERFP